jgi:DNA-binding CsgD family transcriptional regulator
LVFAGELVAADGHCARLAADPALHAAVLLTRARIARWCGDLDDVGRLLASLTTAADEVMRTTAVAGTVEALLLRGAVADAQAVFARREPVGEPFARAVELATSGALALASGRAARALQDCLACGDVLAGLGIHNPAVSDWRRTAALAAPEADQAWALARQEYAAAARWGEPRVLGCALAVLGRLGDGTEVLAEAAQLLEFAQARAELAQVSRLLGERLAARGATAAARDRFGCAATLAAEVGDVRAAQTAGDLAARLAVTRERPELTRQEQRIAALARAGYTNRQIAATVRITLRTVEFHLSQTYRKLGITGRRDLRHALDR